jgi:RimJ/RimL family protein N-acetyltransferase
VGLPLVTERLELRAFEHNDLEALHAIYPRRWGRGYATEAARAARY